SSASASVFTTTFSEANTPSLPSRLTTAPSRRSSSPSHVVSAPIGTEQPPSNVLKRDLSARQARYVPWCMSGPKRALVASSPLRISIPRAPCPTACSTFGPLRYSVTLFSQPNLFNPAAASIMQAYSESLSSSLFSLVPRFPLTLANLRPGYALTICAERRTDDVPTTLPGGSSAKDLYVDPAFMMTASLGSSLSITAPSAHSSGSCVGMSRTVSEIRSPT